MRHAFGLSSPDREPLWPLEEKTLVRFGTDSSHANGYFWFFSPLFNQYAERHAGLEITSINVMFVLGNADLKALSESVEIFKQEVARQPTKWREHLGEIIYPGKAPVPLVPLLFRSRALNILCLLQKMVQWALREQKVLVYGNGVYYRHLVGAQLPVGTEEYS